MPDLANRITEQEASLLRLGARGEANALEILGESGRFWAPIEYAAATGKARCRLCGEKVRREEPAIAFGIDADPGRSRSVATAWLHVKCPTEGE